LKKMQRIAPYLPIPTESTAEQAAGVLARVAPLAAYFHGMNRSNKTRTRERLAAAGYPAEVVDVLLPRLTAGPRAAGAVPEGSPWLLLGGPSRVAVMDALGLEALPENPAYWFAENASRAADAIAARHPNDNTATLNLGKLRNVLRLLFLPAELPTEVLAATLRPEITERHNETAAKRLGERIAEGVDVPEPYRRIADVRERVAAFVAGETPPSGQALADILVTFAARPGEAERLELGERGAVRGITAGVLKKRGKDGEAVYPVVSALGEEMAGRLLGAWKRVALRDRLAAKRDLVTLSRGWGIVPRDLRAIGAALAVRAAVLAGDAVNVGQQREILRGALRHKPERAQAREHYERVSDPLAQLCAQFAELSTEDRARIVAEVNRLASA
jgi:hypothetical protein